jgi:septal ring factor EnvC (AmiA/AmiB activator)
MENEYMEDDPAMIESDDMENDDLELESILRELEGEDDEDPMASMAPAPAAPAPVAPAPAAADPLAATYSTPEEPVVSDDELDEILREMEDEDMCESEDELDEILREMEDEEYEAEPVSERRQLQAENRRLKRELTETKSTLKKAYAAVTEMKKHLNETTLLNTKLIYATNLNRHFSLTENQQTTVLNAFDKATTVREAKLLYTTLAESLKQTNDKRVLKESASKSINSKQIIPANRFQVLAGIK